jgi:glycosyltransferase involved in cell wall biosynthesis
MPAFAAPAEADAHCELPLSAASPPLVSCLLPVRNAMPWLADAVGSVLAQRGVSLELIAVDDCSTDNSLTWLRACEASLLELRSRPPSLEAAAPQAAYYDTVVQDALAGAVPWEPAACRLLSPSAVAALAQPGVSLRVLSVQATGQSGQGLALNTALACARGELVGEMEADDLRPPHAFAALCEALRQNPCWHGVSSRVALAGWPNRKGMQRWIEWQNGVGSGGAHELAWNRYVEIPALRAAGLYRRRALRRLGPRAYRDIWPLPCSALADGALLPSDVAPDEPLPGWWPVDSDFFGRWFDCGLVLGKLAEELYVWRQYPAQSTRTHSRCAQERLRSCKAHFLISAGGPAHGAATAEGTLRCELWACGQTLGKWERALRTAGVLRLSVVCWRPGEPTPDDTQPLDGALLVRLWAFGMERAREKVRLCAPGGFQEAARDWWIA